VDIGPANVQCKFPGHSFAVDRVKLLQIITFTIAFVACHFRNASDIVFATESQGGEFAPCRCNRRCLSLAMSGNDLTVIVQFE